jgi:hypothetical protein
MKKILMTGAASALLFSAMLGNATAAPPKDDRLALTITATIKEQVGPQTRCPSNFGGTITGQGYSELLGPVVLIGTDCITPSGSSFNFTQGKMVIMNADGDQIFADYSGQFVPTGEGARFVFSNASFQIIGGNGDFKKITGGGSLTGGEDMATGNGDLVVSGTVRYPKKVKTLLSEINRILNFGLGN